MRPTNFRNLNFQTRFSDNLKNISVTSGSNPMVLITKNKKLFVIVDDNNVLANVTTYSILN